MKKYSCLKFLLAALVSVSLLPVNSTRVSAEETFDTPAYELAQKKRTRRSSSAFDRYMRLGYTATGGRQYLRALKYFRLALGQRPGNKYALRAIRNVQSYRSRNRRRLGYPYSRGIPARVRSAGKRGACIKRADKPVPFISQEVEKTTESNPNFFFYIPEASSDKPLKFVVYEREGNRLKKFYEKDYQAIDKAAIVKIVLPTNKSLQTTTEYYWSLSVVCDAIDVSNNADLVGRIRRELNEDFSDVLETASPKERANIYSSAGYWQDAMAVLADLRRQKPGNAGLKNEWQELLKAYFKSLEPQDDQQETEESEQSTDSKQEQNAVKLEDKILQADIVDLN